MKTKTLHDVYFNALNFNERVVVTRHAVERIIERKIDVETFILLLKRDIVNHMCERIYECITRNGSGTQITGYGIKVPVSFNEDSMKLFIRTVF